MKSTFNDRNNIHIRTLSDEDGENHRRFLAQLPAPERYAHYLDNQNPDIILFGLFKDDRMIGQTIIALAPDAPLAVFCESEILPAYQGQGLSSQLYDARFRYLEQRQFSGTIETHIKPDNVPSLKAAARNGFADTGATHKGYCVLDQPFAP